MYKYFVKADHPVLMRIDEFVEAGDLGEFVAELTAAGYENISVDTIQLPGFFGFTDFGR